MVTRLEIGRVNDAGVGGREPAGEGGEFEGVLALKRGKAGGLAISGVEFLLLQGAEFGEGGGAGGIGGGGLLLTQLGEPAGFALGGFLFGGEAGGIGGEAGGFLFGGFAGLGGGELVGTKLREARGGLLGFTLRLKLGEAAGLGFGRGFAGFLGEAVALGGIAPGGELEFGAGLVVFITAVAEKKAEEQGNDGEDRNDSFIHRDVG